VTGKTESGIAAKVMMKMAHDTILIQNRGKDKIILN
jgi:hypothetical protein